MNRILALQALRPEPQPSSSCFSASWSDWSILTE